jgi:tryptophan halogenase
VDQQIKKIVIVGRDADAWLSALMLQLSFLKSETPVEVHLVELPSKLHPNDAYAVLPSHKVLHKVLGISESLLFKTSAGQYALGQRFVNWSGNTSQFFHGYDTHGVNMGYVDFLQYWIKARQKGFDVPLEDFSLGVEVAKQGRFLVFNDESQSFSKATYGYHLNALTYLGLIAKAAVKSGLRHHVKQIKSIASNSDRISSVTLDDGSIIEGDFFIDASGEDAVLISRIEEESNLENWQKWLPCDRRIKLSAPPLSPAPVFAQIAAFKQGWIGFFPLPGRTAITASYSSQEVSSGEVLNTINLMSRAKIEHPVEENTVCAARKKHWVGNCVAIGTAAVNLDTLDATQLHILHLGLSLLRTLFPVDKQAMIEASVFNQKMQSFSINLRDFQIAHYKLNKRHGDTFWDKLRDMAVPDSLSDKIQLFAYRGHVALREEETFQEESWASIFVGHGLIPQTYDPLVDKVSEAEYMQQFQRILQYISTETQNMPSMAAHLEMNFESNSNPYQSMF